MLLLLFFHENQLWQVIAATQCDGKKYLTVHLINFQVTLNALLSDPHSITASTTKGMPPRYQYLSYCDQKNHQIAVCSSIKVNTIVQYNDS